MQFVGPVQDDWYANLRDINGLKIVSYIPENAYLLWMNSTAKQSVDDWRRT